MKIALICLIAIGAIIPFLFSTRWLATILFLPVFLLAGYVTTVLHTDRLYDDHYSKFSLNDEAYFLGELSSDVIPRTKSYKAEMSISAMINGDDTTTLNGILLVYFQKDTVASELGYGDQVILKGRLNEIVSPQNPKEFNYKRYMGFHQVTHQIYTPTEDWIKLEEGTGLVRYIKDLQHDVLSILTQQGINDRELAILSALLVGYKHHLSVDQVNAFASAGAMHVLAVSGLHVGIIFLIISSLLKPIEKVKYGIYIKGVLVLLTLWMYAAITGLSPSVTRAATMFSFVIAAQQFKRHTNIFNTLATSATALLIINPFLIVEVGFQLSYLAVLGIVVLQPHIYGLWETENWLLEKLWAITSVSVAAQVATFPLGLLYFHQFPNYFLLSNLVVIPAATAILPIGIALIVLNWVPILNTILGTVLYYLVHWLDMFIQWVEVLPGALILGIDISIFETYFIYMIIMTSVVFLIGRRYKWLVAFLVSFISIETLNIIESFQQKHQQMLVIYKVKGHEAMSMISGHQQRFVADEELTTDFDKMRFHIHHHWWSLDLDEPTWTEFNPGFYFVNEKSLLVMGDETKVPKAAPELDLLYLTERTSDHPKSILESINVKEVILSCNLDWKTRSYWQQLLKEKSIPYHDIRSEGAFVMDNLPD